MIYFIEAVGTRRVKIGFAENPEERLQDLQVGCPFKLRLLCIVRGAREIEGVFHRAFERDRFRGEWFWLSTAIRDFIKRRRLLLVCPACGCNYLGYARECSEVLYVAGDVCGDCSEAGAVPCEGKLVALVYEGK